jgi:predicted aspartyl protease
MKITKTFVCLLALSLPALLMPLRAAAAAPSAHFATADGIAHIPFSFDNNHIFVDVKLQSGKVASFMLDTGSDYTLLNASFAREAGVHSSGDSSIHGAGGQVSMSFADGQTLTLAGLDVTVDRMVVMDLDNLTPTAGWRIQGVLGNDVLHAFTVQIDYAAKMLTLYRAGVYHAPEHATVLPLSSAAFSGSVFVPATLTLPGRAPVDISLAIDTGASATDLNSPFVDSSGAIQAVGKTISYPTRGAGNAHFDTLMGRIAGLKLGPYLLVDPVVGLSRASDGVLASSNFEGILGNDVLKRFTMTLDYPDKQLILTPNAELGTPFRIDASGMLLVAKGADLRSFEVQIVEADSPALGAGVQVGDIIEAIDGGPAARYDLSDIKSVLRQEGTTHTLTLRRGTRHLDVTLKLRRLL